MPRTIPAVLLAVAALLQPGGARAFQDAPAPSNVSAVQQLVTGAVGKMLSAAGLRAGDTIVLRLPARGDRWLFETPAAARLAASGLAVSTAPADSHALRMELGMATGDVRYGELFRDGLFGTRRVERTARVGLSGTISRRGELLWSGTIDTLGRDTIDAGDIDRLEEGAPSSLKDEPPDETFLDRILEPFVILGATGAAIYLLFHVRS